MEDLRLVGLSADGSRLVLENSAGDSLALPLDERVHAALRGDRSRLGQLQIAIEGEMRPREIQARIRAGATAEEVASSAGLPVDRVRRFETPILLERTHMAQQAQRVGVRRVTDSVTTPLGVLVQTRLEEHGVSAEELDWDSFRREDGRWQVTLQYAAGGRDRSAAWLFDPVRRQLEPVDDDARWLTEEERAAPPPAAPARPRRAAPRLASVPRSEPEPEPEQAPAPAAATRPLIDVVPDLVEDDVDEDAVEDDAVEDDAVEDGPQAAPAEAEPVEAEESRSRVNRVPAAKPRSGGRRAAVPSWDEILFGSAPPRGDD